jgi:hypothetical protein
LTAPLTALAVAIGWSVTFLATAEEQRLYRYINNDGVVVVDWQIPAEYIAKGYQVLNEQGIVIDRVEPLAEGVDGEQLRRARLAADAERRRDESLLRKYSTVADIEAARDRALRELKIRISILKSNLRSFRQTIENQQLQIATAERQGEAVSTVALEKIATLRAEIASTERAIAEREKEAEDLSALYEKDMQRFAEIADLVDVRRRMSAPAPRSEP